MTRAILGLVSLFAAFGLQPAVAQNTPPSLADALKSANSSLSTLTGLLQSQPGTLDTLNKAQNITILAPNNDALSDFLGNMSMSDIDTNMVTALLSYHVLNGTYFSDNITDTAAFVPTLLNDKKYANVTGGQVVEALKENDTVSFYSGLRMQSNVTQANITFTGGVIHIINQVLTIPMNLSSTAVEGNLTAAAGALKAADLVNTLDEATNITVFAPRNDAFVDIANILQNLTTQDLRSILGYHVIEGTVAYSSDLENGTQATSSGEDVEITVLGSDVYVDSAKVVQPDILIANGVVHIIDRVLNPNSTDDQNTPNTSTTTPAFTGASTLTDGGIPFTSGLPSPTQTQTDLGGVASTTNSGGEAGARATAMVGMGALFGGAAILANGF